MSDDVSADVSVDDVREVVGAGTNDESMLSDCLDVAVEQVDAYVEDVDVATPIPAATLRRAYIAVAVELFNQNKAPNGIVTQQFVGADGAAAVPIRIGADPLRPAYPLLRHWVAPLGFA